MVPNLISSLKFASMHTHDEFSDGAGRISDLMDYASELKLDAICETNHGTLAGAVTFWKEATERNILPIFGVEGYLKLADVPNRFHITIVSHGQEGYETLVTLNNESHKNIERGRLKNFPILTLEMMRDVMRSHSGISILSGCPAAAIHSENFSLADYYVRSMMEIFGKDNFYIELMAPLDGQDFITRPLLFANKYNLKTVWTNDTHLIRPNTSLNHEIIIKSKKGLPFDSGNLHLMGREEMWELATKITGEEEATKAFVGIDELVRKSSKVNLKHEPMIPMVPEEIEIMKKDLLAALEEDVRKNAFQEEIRRNRFRTEWTLLDEYPQFWHYFAIVYDLVRFAKERGIKNGVRGSAAGSYLLYLLRISQADPIEYGLLFERFLNRKRLEASEYPDLDADVQSDRRQEIQDYALRKYGMLPVATYNTFSHSALVRAIGRGVQNALGIEIPDEVISEISEIGDDETEGLYDRRDEVWSQFLSFHPIIEEVYDSELGAVSHIGKHAAALVSLPKGLIVPVEALSGEPMVAFSESGSVKSLTEVGGVKMDILGLTTLSLIAEMERDTGVKAPDDFEPGDEIFKKFQNLELTGLFQFSSALGRRLCKMIQPNSIEELSDVTSLGRPGPMGSGFHITYAHRDADVSWYPEAIQQMLEPTRGVMIYQEQIARIAGHMLAFENESEGLEYGCKILKELVPKSPKVREQKWWQDNYKKIRSDFINGGIENHGYDPEVVEKIFLQVEKFVGYAFNKSHSISYALLSAKMAWFMTNHPSAYYKALLNGTVNTSQFVDKLLRYIMAARLSGAKIRPPHINISTDRWEYYKGEILVPLTMARGIGEAAASSIVEERTKNGPFKSLADVGERLDKRSLNKTARLKLWQAGAFEGLDGTLYELGALEHKVFKRKEDYFEPEPEEISAVAGMKNLLGFTLPTDEIIDAVRWAEDKENKIIGYVVSAELGRVSKKGTVMNWYELDNNQSFWQLVDGAVNLKKIANANGIPYNKGVTPIEIGRLVGVTLMTDKEGKSYGMAKTIRFLDE